MSATQTMFSFGPNFTGMPCSVDEPSPRGPRHEGQSSARAMVAIRRRTTRESRRDMAGGLRRDVGGSKEDYTASAATGRAGSRQRLELLASQVALAPGGSGARMNSPGAPGLTRAGS